MFHKVKNFVDIPTQPQIIDYSECNDDASKQLVLNKIAAVENFDGQPFNINEAGFVRNDLSRLARAQTQQEFQLILSQLSERESSSLPKDMPVADAIKLCRPRYAQSPSELAEYSETLAQYQFARQQKVVRQRAVAAADSSVADSPAVDSAPVASSSK